MSKALHSLHALRAWPCWLALAGACAAAQPQPPAAPVRDVPEAFFGTTVADPYRDLEDTRNPAVQAWMRAQDAHAQATLERNPGRAILLQRYQADDRAASVRVTNITREPGERWFFQRRAAGDDQYKLVLRQGLAGPERVLVAPQAGQAVTWVSVAPGGRSLAYGLSRQGAEDATLHVVGSRSGRQLVTPVPRADFGGVSWAPDGLHLVFNRLAALPSGAPDTDKYLRSQVLLMRLGDSAEQARPVLAHGMPGVSLEPAEVPTVQLTHDGRWALGYVFNGTQREISLYVSPQPALLAGRPQWRRLLGPEDQVFAATYFGDTLYALGEKAAPRGQLLALDLRSPAATPQVLLAQGSAVLINLGAAADALYLELREGNTKRLHKRPWAATGANGFSGVPLPLAGSFTLADPDGGVAATDPRLPGAVLELQGWTRARQVLQVHSDGRVSNTGLQPAGPRDAPADLVATEVLVKSHDGALVPLSVLHKKDLQFNGRNPTLLVGYGAYGSTLEPSFNAERLAWLDAGGVVALANPRGSGVYGNDWYRAGWQQSKPNTWKDIIACAQWLVDNGWTQPQHLGVWGGSAGGVLAGRAITERPELFGAAVIQVGVLDALRAELTANGVPNIPEFGSRATEAGFRSLLAMSTYHQVRDGVKYPAVLLTHGVNDPRVDVWHSLKAAARLQAASTSGKPVLLRLDWAAGHGVGSTKAQQQALRADTYSFMGWQLGLEGFRLP